MRGVYTVAVLCELENCLGVELTNQFDVFVGTSVGGLLALGLSCGISCRVILETMKDSMERIFGNPVPWNPLGLRAAKHKADALRDCVERIFGENYNRNIVDLRKNVIVSSIDVDRNEIVYFSNVERIGSTICLNASLIDVALATTAAPTYFPPHTIDGRQFWDGGLASNNPDIEALRFCTTYFSRSVQSVSILSVGTGHLVYSLSGKNLTNPGLYTLMRRVRFVDRVFSLQESKATGLVSDVLGERYCRIDSPFDREIKLDDFRAATVELLIQHGKAAVSRYWPTECERLASFIR